MELCKFFFYTYIPPFAEKVLKFVFVDFTLRKILSSSFDNITICYRVFRDMFRDGFRLFSFY